MELLGDGVKASRPASFGPGCFTEPRVEQLKATRLPLEQRHCVATRHLLLNNAPPAGRKYLLCPFEVGPCVSLSASPIPVVCPPSRLPSHYPPPTTSTNCCMRSHQTAAVVLPRAEQLLRSSVQPYINSILEALMEPTSRGFSEVRDVFFKELVEISKNSLNGGGKEKLGEVRAPSGV